MLEGRYFRPGVALACAAALAFPSPSLARNQNPASPLVPPSLYQALADFFPVGAAVWKGDLSGEHAELLKKHFISITPENYMKWQYLRPSEGVYDFSQADALASFAAENHLRMRGHTLVWHQQNPAWLFKDAAGRDLQATPEDKTLLLQRLQDHIRTVVAHYKNAVYAWDVVNEVIDPAEPDGFRRSRWFQITGTDFIDVAFRTAREAAPGAVLFINDYDTTEPVKRTFLYNLVRDLRRRGIPVDGVGHQMHIHLKEPSVDSVVQSIQMFSQLGVDNQVTELDVSVYPDSGNRESFSSVSTEMLLQQGRRYRDLFAAFRGLKGQLSGVTFWGVADDHTWLKQYPFPRLDLPLLFDDKLQPKYAFWGIVDPASLPTTP